MKGEEERTEALQKLYDKIPAYENSDVPSSRIRLKNTKIGYSVACKEYMLPVSDGVCLRTQCWFPVGKKQISVVVTRSCYQHQEAEFMIHGMEYAKRGFGFVVQWCRGTNGSQGTWEPNTYERLDGLALMEWISALPYVKNIGYWGNSYLASAGWCMADAVPRKVKSMYLGVYGTDRYTSVYQDGLFRQDIFTWWTMTNAGRNIEADYLESCKFRPQIDVDEALWGVHLDWYRDWVSNTDRDSDYWTREGFWKMLAQIPEKLQIPVFIREGWYDHHLGSAAISWQKLSEQSRRHSTFQIGPWRHEYDFKLDGQTTDHLEDDSVSSPYDWFDSTLRKDEFLPQRCHLYQIGADRWLTFEQLPELGERQEVLYLDAEAERIFDLQQADTEGISGASGILSREIPSEQRCVSYQYDPREPVMSHGTEACFKTKKAIGSLYQPACDYRSDVISFVSKPYEKELDLAGSLTVRLYVRSDVEDTSFTAKIMEVFENGRCVNIRSSITTLAYRNQAAKRKKYIPGETVEVTFKMWPIVWRIRRNSRIRVDISSSDFPQYAVHSNYPGVWSKQKKTRIANQTVCVGGACASCVILPIYEEETDILVDK